MFDLGIIPKRLRSASDRSKFYKLIEASLYGGISSAITRSLRDCSLPEKHGVRKAFQDMESDVDAKTVWPLKQLKLPNLTVIYSNI